MPFFFFACLAIIAVSYFPSLPSFNTLFIFATGGLVWLFYQRSLWLAGLLCGFLFACIYGHHLLLQQLPQALDGRDFWVSGEVTGLPVSDTRKTRLDLRVSKIHLFDQPEKGLKQFRQKKIRLNLYYTFLAADPHSEAYPQLKPGDSVRLKARLRRPRGFVNPAGFDYQWYLLRQDIVATGYAKPFAGNRLEQADPVASVDRLRLAIRQSLQLPGVTEARGPLLGLISGDKTLITDEQWQVFKSTGTVHLMVISGLHIGLLGLFGFWLGRLLAGLVSRLLPLPQINRYLPALLSITLATVYCVLSGSGMAAQRALLMLLVLHSFTLLRLRFRPWLALLVAAFAVLLIDPLVARSPGFVLSFGAVAVLLFTFSGYRQKLPWYRQWLKAQYVLVPGLLLPSLLAIEGVSVPAFVANLIAIPLVSFVVVPLALLSALLMIVSDSLWQPVFAFAGEVFTPLLALLGWMARELPGFVGYPQALLQPAAVVLAAIAGVALLVPMGIRFYGLAALCFLPLLIVSREPPLLRLSFLDAGQGTAVLLETREHRLVYDLGKRYSKRFDVGEHLMAPYLQSLGYNTVDALVVSHGDSDHAGGLPGFLRTLDQPPARFYAGQAEKTGGEQCLRGQSWYWDGVHFEVLWPTQAFLQKEKTAVSNDFSCVLRISINGHRVLLAGDISRWTEQRLLADLDKTDIVLAPHHGSKTSSGKAWLERLGPDHVVFTTGYKNRYGHPHSAVVRAYRDRGSRIYNTAEHGALRFSLDKKGEWHSERFRHDYARYWYDRQLVF